jgi:hypothetical protein
MIAIAGQSFISQTCLKVTEDLFFMVRLVQLSPVAHAARLTTISQTLKKNESRMNISPKTMKIYRSAKLDKFEIDMVESYIEEDNDGCFIDTAAYEKLFDWFCTSQEMPYGVAKCRTGEPDLWIIDRLRQDSE